MHIALWAAIVAVVVAAAVAIAVIDIDATDDEPAAPGPANFTTAPSTTGSPSTTAGAPQPTTSAVDRPTSFVVIGDYGVGSPAERSVAAQVRRWVAAHDATAIVTTGDNVYPDGHPRRFEAAWREPYGWVRDAGLTVHATLGNHDHTDGGRPVMALLDMPARWYRARIGDVDLFALDANHPGDAAQRGWLVSELAKPTPRWKVVAFHQPAYSCSAHDGSAAVVAAWVDVFERYGVDLVLTGHDHNYQRFDPRGGVTHVVAGGGGAPLYDIDACTHGEPPMAVGVDDVHSFVAVRATGTVLRITAVSVTGAVLDDTRLRR